MKKLLAVALLLMVASSSLATIRAETRTGRMKQNRKMHKSFKFYLHNYKLAMGNQQKPTRVQPSQQLLVRKIPLL
ncbi:hypothetical protein AAHE18_16G198600 [Arachis hypogaea]